MTEDQSTVQNYQTPNQKPMPTLSETQGMNYKGNGLQPNTIPYFPDLFSFVFTCVGICAL